MNKSLRSAALTLSVLLGAFAVSSFSYAGTTTADFLKWSENQQNSYFQTAISMATTIASQTRPEIAQCLNDWYYANADLAEQRNSEIVEVMPQYSNYHPSTVVLAYIEGVCGKFAGN